MKQFGLFKKAYGPNQITYIKELQEKSVEALLEIAKEKGIEIDPTKDKSKIIGILSKAEGYK